MMKTLLVATGLLAACGNATTSGPYTIGTTTFDVADAATMIRTERRLANVVLTSFADACSVADESTHPNTEQLTFLLADLDADAPPSAPGTYPVFTLETLPTTGLAAECGFAMPDATCQLSGAECTSGTVTLTRVSSDGYAGSFDVIVEGSHITGSFDAASCPNVSEDGFGTCTAPT